MNNLIKLGLYTTLLGLGLNTHAAYDHRQDTVPTSEPVAKVVASVNEAVIQVKGAVCSFCSLGIQKN